MSLITGTPGASGNTASNLKPVASPPNSAMPGSLFPKSDPNPQSIPANALAVPAPSPSRAAKALQLAIGSSLAPFSGLEHVVAPYAAAAAPVRAAQPASGGLMNSPAAAPAPAPEPAAGSAAGVRGALELSAAGVAAGAMAVGAGAGAGAGAGMAASAAGGVGTGHGGAPAGAGAAGPGNQALQPASTFGSLPAPVRALLAQFCQYMRPAPCCSRTRFLQTLWYDTLVSAQVDPVPTPARWNPEPGTMAPALTAASDVPTNVGAQQGSSQYAGAQQDLTQYAGAQQGLPQYAGAQQGSSQYAGAQQGASQHMAASSTPDDNLEALPPGDAYLDGGIYEGLGADPCCMRLTQSQPGGADAGT